MSVLRRLGNKSKIAKKILPYFPKHDIYIELFFGAGGMFFNKPLSKYSICNDVDEDVFNLFMVIKEHREELKRRIKQMPIHNSLLQYWRKQKENDPIWKAVRFLFISNFTFMGKGSTLRTLGNTKRIILRRIDPTFEKIQNVFFLNGDFRDVPRKITKQDLKKNIFICADPPYVDTAHNYSEGFKKSDTEDLFTMLQELDKPFLISEFDNPFVMDLASDKKLRVDIIGERRNLSNRRTEIIISNITAPI